MFLKWLQGQTKAPTNMINALTSVDFVDATLQTLQELFKGLPPPPPPKPNPKDGKLLALSRDVRQGQLPPTIEVNP